jgi:hypothetical protein
VLNTFTLGIRVVECTGCFCGSDEANRLVCTETNLEMIMTMMIMMMMMMIIIIIIIIITAIGLSPGGSGYFTCKI